MISQDGIEKALEKGKEDYDRRQYDLEVSVFTHIIAGIIYGPRDAIPHGPVSKKWLFEIFNTRTYQSMFRSSLKKCSTDEIPSDFMRNLYEDYKKWKEHGGATTKHVMTRSFEERYELGEYKKEKWMKKIES